MMMFGCICIETLPEFIAYHTLEKLCLPCKLVLPVGEFLPAQNKSDALKKDSDIQRKLKGKEAMSSSSHNNLRRSQSEDIMLRRPEKNDSAAEGKRLSTIQNEDTDSRILKL